VTSFADPHFRVVRAALDTMVQYMDLDGSHQFEMPENYFPLLLGIPEDPQLRSKQFIRDSAVKLLEHMHERTGPTLEVTLCVDILNKAEYHRQAHIRHGAIKMLAEKISLGVDYFQKLSCTLFFVSFKNLMLP